MGTGQEDPEHFNPTQVRMRVSGFTVLKETGFKKLILVVKHHDGFVPIRRLTQIIRLRPVLGGDGEGDLLLEVSQAATEFDMDMGVYLSPWDAHSPLYHVEREADYNAYYLAPAGGNFIKSCLW